MSGAPGCLEVHSQRALLTDREPILGRLAVDEEATPRSKVGCRTGPIRSVLLSDDEEQPDSTLALLGKRSAAATMAAARPFASQLPRP